MINLETIIQEQGSRKHNEDTHAMLSTSLWTCFAVFDGHGGDKVSKHLSHPKHGLLQFIVEENKLNPEWESKQMREVLQNCFTTYDSILESKFGSKSKVGSTACLALFTADGRDLWICNLGDSRCAIYDLEPNKSSSSTSKSGSPSSSSLSSTSRLRFMTLDHKPHTREEKTRIEAIGGEVTHQAGDVARVNNLTAVSRSFGDFHLKPYVSADPDVYHIAFAAGVEEFYLVLATDGIWDDISVSRINSYISQWPNSFSRKIVDNVLRRQEEADNITIVSIHFSNKN